MQLTVWRAYIAKTRPREGGSRGIQSRWNSGINLLVSPRIPQAFAVWSRGFDRTVGCLNNLELVSLVLRCRLPFTFFCR